MYKVFINGKSLILTDNYEDYTSGYDSLFIRHSDNETLTTTVDLLIESPVLSTIYIFDENLTALWEAFNSHYEKVEAAGGVVKKGDLILFIYKNKHWDLPKGKMEKGEGREACALREVKEECGISKLDISDPIDTIYHVYKEASLQLFQKQCKI